jgi:chromosome segregation ATPase
MTLGTNASMAEQIEYAPSEINFEAIVEAIEELEEWRELLNAFEYCAKDVEQRINDYKSDIEAKDNDIEELEAKVDELSEEISYLKNRIEELEWDLEDAENQA